MTKCNICNYVVIIDSLIINKIMQEYATHINNNISHPNNQLTPIEHQLCQLKITPLQSNITQTTTTSQPILEQSSNQKTNQNKDKSTAFFNDPCFKLSIDKVNHFKQNKEKSSLSFLQELKDLKRKQHKNCGIKALLKTQFGIVHSVVQKYFEYGCYNKEDQYGDIFIIWMDNYISEEFVKRLNNYQKINHFPNSCELGRKDRLADNLNFHRRIMPQHFNFFPLTYILPRELESYNQQKIPNKYYIVKPHANCQGRGIYLAKAPTLTIKDQVIVQQYIQHPMLIDGHKFDLRLYVLLSSLQPLRIYVYREGLCRLATVKYSKPNDKNYGNDKMHLTNYAINKNSPDFMGNKDSREDHRGHKRSYSATMCYLQSQHFDTAKIQDRIDSIILKTIMSSYTKLLRSYKKTREHLKPYHHLKDYVNPNQQKGSLDQESVCFQLLGFDILLLESGEPVLLEVNHQPSLVTDSPLDISVKKYLIMDTINLLNIQEKDREISARCKAEGLTYSSKFSEQKQMELIGGFRRIYPTGISKQTDKNQQQIERINSKHQYFESIVNKVMFRQFKRLNNITKTKLNYRTISTRHNATRSQKRQQQDINKMELPLTSDHPRTGSIFRTKDNKQVALTFYKLFQNQSNPINSQETNTQTTKRFQQIQDKQIKNHLVLIQLQKESGRKLRDILRERKGISLTIDKHSVEENKSNGFREVRKNKYDHLKIIKEHPITKKQDKSINDQLSTGSNDSPYLRWNLLSNRTKINFNSSNTRNIQNESSNQFKTSELVPIFSVINTTNKNSKQHQSIQREEGKSTNLIASAEKQTPDKIQKQIDCRQIYCSSMKQKMERINYLKLIKSNIQKLNIASTQQKQRVKKWGMLNQQQTNKVPHKQ